MKLKYLNIMLLFTIGFFHIILALLVLSTQFQSIEDILTIISYSTIGFPSLIIAILLIKKEIPKTTVFYLLNFSGFTLSSLYITSILPPNISISPVFYLVPIFGVIALILGIFTLRGIK